MVCFKRKKTRSKARILRVSKTQTGKSNLKKDRKLKAKLPGKRRSPSGKIYYETRKNRSDKKGKRI